MPINSSKGVSIRDIAEKYKYYDKDYDISKCVVDLQSLKISEIVISKKYLTVYGL